MSENTPSDEDFDQPSGEEVVAGSVDCLRGAPLFAGVSDELVRQAATLFSLRRVGAGTIVDPGAAAPDGGVFVIRRGKIRIEHRIATRTALTSGVLGQGDAFGLQSLFGYAPQSVGLASQPALLLQAPANLFLRVVDDSLELWRNIARLHADALAATAAALQSFRSIELARRLLAIFERTAREHGIEVADGTLLDVALYPADIAALAGASEEHVADALALLEREGRLRIERSLIRLLSDENS